MALKTVADFFFAKRNRLCFKRSSLTNAIWGAAAWAISVHGVRSQNMLFDRPRTERAASLSGAGWAGAGGWDGATRNPAAAVADTSTHAGVALHARRRPGVPVVVAFSLPFHFRNRTGFWCAGADYIRLNSARYTDSTGLTSGGFNAAEVGLNAGYGRMLGRRLSIGAALGYVYTTFVGVVPGQRQRGPGHAIRLAMLGHYRLLQWGQKRRFSLLATAGLVELGPPVRYFHPQRKTPLASSLVAGMAAGWAGPTVAFTFFADAKLCFTCKNVVNVATGAEMSLRRQWWWRTGISRGDGTWRAAVGTAYRLVDVVEIGFGYDGGYFAALGVFWRK